jgi:phage FluMu protein gp41
MAQGTTPIKLELRDVADDRLRMPALILQYTLDSVNHLLLIYNVFQQIRRKLKRGGAPRTEEQDLLRATVVMACAGLDACVKSLIQYAIKDVVRKRKDSNEALLEFVRRRLRGGEGEMMLDTKVLAELLVSDRPSEKAAEMAVEELRGRSLQSVEELRRAARFLGVVNFPLPERELKDLFRVRNQIVHEMDVDLENPHRRRRPRRREEMVKYAETALRVGAELIKECDQVMVADRDADRGKGQDQDGMIKRRSAGPGVTK